MVRTTHEMRSQMNRIGMIQNDFDRATLRATAAFLEDRLNERGAIEWALGLSAAQIAERAAVDHMLNRANLLKLDEPWTSTWRLIQESWTSESFSDDQGLSAYGLQERLKSGDRSGNLIGSIVDLARPRLSVTPIASWRTKYATNRRKPKSFHDLVHTKLTSGRLADTYPIQLSEIENDEFLTSLANRLEAAISEGVEIARRIGWGGIRNFWHLGGLLSVYPRKTNGEDTDDVDYFHQGIAPSVKLFYSVIQRIAFLNRPMALPLIQQLHHASSAVHRRLWAAFAFDTELVPIGDVEAFLAESTDHEFWEAGEYPEIAELRAKRFSELSSTMQKDITTRLLKGPPRSLWPRNADREKVRTSRIFQSVQELKRIENLNNFLPTNAQNWLQSNIQLFPSLNNESTDIGLPEGVTVSYGGPAPDRRFDEMSGLSRIRALESALASNSDTWQNDTAGMANAWLIREGNATKIILDLAALPDSTESFPRLWDRLGWAHSLGSDAARNATEALVVLRLIKSLPNETKSFAIEGLSYWLDRWRKCVEAMPVAIGVWMDLWPYAVAATNAQITGDEDVNLSVVARSSNEDEDPMDLDTLNTPVGRLVGVFLQWCPNADEADTFFRDGEIGARMRDTIVSASGRSDLIAKHRLIEALPYFMRTNKDWSEQFLIRPLLRDDAAALALWRAIARRTHFYEVLQLIGPTMVVRATDRRLARQTRRSLIFSLVVETMHAFREKREPAVSNMRIGQMLRAIEDELRAHAAGATQQFLSDVTVKLANEPIPPERALVFREAVMPFLTNVWPQETSLTTPSISRAFADLPATAQDAFAEAVTTIQRFLVPFECWSMLEYGLYGEEDGKKKIEMINNRSKAEALLVLLDATIGGDDGDVVPLDLSEALQQAQLVAPTIVDTPSFRRLSTLSRR